MKTLLAVIEDLLNMERFIEYNINLAGDMNFNLHLLYIQNPALYTLSTGTAAASSQPMDNEVDVIRLETERKNALESINKQADKLCKNLSQDISTEVSAEAGTIKMVVNQYITNIKAEMIVLKGQDEVDFWLIDTANTDVIQKVNCPGWIIPSDFSYKPFKKIIYATDYNEADIQTLKRLVTLTKNFSPEITALHITDSLDFEEKAAKEGFKDMIVKETNYEKIFIKTLTDEKKKNTGEQINEYAAGKGFDLIALMKENKGFFDKIFKPSTTKQVIQKIRLPVLVFHKE